MPIAGTREASNLLAGAAIVVVGAAALPAVVPVVVGTVLVGVGTELLAGVAEKAWAPTRDWLFERLTGPPSAERAALVSAAQRAIERTTKELRGDWWASEAGKRIRRDDRHEIGGMFATLESAGSSLGPSTLVGLVNHQSMATTQTAAQLVDEELKTLLYGHPDELNRFIRGAFLPSLQRCFAQELQADTSLGTAAWRAYQQMIGDLIVSHLVTASDAHDQAAQVLGRIEEILAEVRAWISEVSDPDNGRSDAGIGGLAVVVEESQAALVDVIAQQLALAREEAARRFEEVRADITALRPDDVGRLRRATRRGIERAAEAACILIGDASVRVARECIPALRTAVEQGSIVVVGEPGAGKSGVLHELAQGLAADGRDVVYLSVDRVDAESLEALRDELGLDLDVVDSLAAWTGDTPALLVVDALDAARSDRRVRALRDLAGEVARTDGRWRVVLSIRSFDLSHDHETRALFRGEPTPGFEDARFPKVRHLAVPLLSDAELAQVPRQSSELGTVLGAAQPPLRELLRLAFNLRLIGELIDEGLVPAAFASISTQDALLERHWERRVMRADGRADARSWVLRRTVEEMLQQRRLRAARGQVITDPSASPDLDDLLRTRFLTTWQSDTDSQPDEEVLAFAHHLHFDHTLARLLLRHLEPRQLAKWIALEPDRLLVVLPSVMAHLRRLWRSETTRCRFWDAALEISVAEGVGSVAAMVGLSVASAQTRNIDDLRPLLKAVGGSNQGQRSAALRALRYLTNALLVDAESGRPLVGAEAGPWCDLLDVVLQRPTVEVVSAMRPLLQDLYRDPSAWTSEQRDAAGRAARALFHHVHGQPAERRDAWLVTTATAAVCRTLESDPSASTNLISSVLGADHVTRYGYEELPALTREVSRLARVAPELAVEVYRASFGYTEAGREPVPMSGKILSRSISRSDEYDKALYELAERYDDLLVTAPAVALEVLDPVIDGYLATQYEVRLADQPVAMMEVSGSATGIIHDRSVSWDGEPPRGHRDPNDLLGRLQAHLERLGEQSAGDEARKAFLRTLVSRPRPASVWRRVLTTGAQHPESLGHDLRALAWSIPILLHADTTDVACYFLSAVFPTLDPLEQGQVRTALGNILTEVPTGRACDAKEVQARLLACLDGSPSAATLRATALGRAPLRYSPEAYWAARENPANDTPAERVLGEVAAMAAPGSNLDHDMVKQVETAISTLRGWLDGEEARRLDRDAHEVAWGQLARCCRLVASHRDLDCDGPLGNLVRSTLLLAVTYPSEPEPDEHFDRDMVIITSDKPRPEATEGLLRLAASPRCGHPALVDALHALAADPDPAVRWEVAAKTSLIAETEPALMWELLTLLAEAERRPGIVHALISGTLSRVAITEPDRAFGLVATILQRGDIEEAEELGIARRACVDLLVRLGVCLGHEQSRAALFGMAAEAASHPNEMAGAFFEVRPLLMLGDPTVADPAEDAVRRRTLELLQEIATSASKTYLEFESTTSDRELSQVDQEQLSGAVRVVTALASELYFGSGAYIPSGDGVKQESTRPTEVAMRRFWDEAAELLTQLARLGFPKAAYDLLQIADAYLVLDPPGAIKLASLIVQAGVRHGLNGEQLACDLAVDMVSRALATHAGELRDNAECRIAVVEILGAFAGIGWPKAIQLVYGLDRIYR